MSYYRVSKEFTGYANSFQSVARLGLESISVLLKHLGNPQDKLKFIHIAGTNGKGSVCVFLQSMLTHAGYKTGIYTSPNMMCVNERVNVDGKNISDDDMNRILGMVNDACRLTEKEVGLYPTQFEIWTAMGMVYFLEQGCDYVVLETGLGGRLDATNVVTTTVLSVITHIALDHTQYLGDTLEKVAFEKAGIIKPGKAVVSAVQSAEAAEVIKSVCEERKCSLYFSDKIPTGRYDGVYEIISEGELEGVKLSLGGINQLDNASCAIMAAKVLDIPKESVIYGLSHAKHIGRFEKMASDTYFDGAHNPDGVLALRKNLDRYFADTKKVYIMAAMADKEVTESLEILKEDGCEFKMVTVKDNERSMSGEDFCKKACVLGLDAKSYENIKEAYVAAKNSGKLIIICGSLYLYKDLVESEILAEYK